MINNILLTKYLKKYAQTLFEYFDYVNLYAIDLNN